MIRIGYALSGSDPQVVAAVASGDRSWIEALARRQLGAGADLLDCGAAGLGDDEESALGWMLEVVEACTDRPVCIDSADPELLARLARGRRHPPWLNSLELGIPWPGPIVDLVESGSSIVVQLRQGAKIPQGAEDRRRLFAQARARTAALPSDRVWFDAVVLPWGEDLDAGDGLFQFLDGLSADERARVVLGLGNVSFGHARRGELHRRWYREFVARGVGGLLLDPFDPALRESSR